MLMLLFEGFCGFGGLAVWGFEWGIVGTWWGLLA
jgi:hypothetical protein